MTKFGTINERGRVTDVRIIAQSALAACPHIILSPDHYRQDGTCRCDDPAQPEMAEWGYQWNTETNRWEAPEDDA